MNLQEQISRIQSMMGVINEDIIKRDPIKKLQELKENLNKLFSYYEIGDDGKVYDKTTENGEEVNIKESGGYFKAKIESVIIGSKRDGTYSKQLDTIKNEIITGDFKKFFGDYNTIVAPKQTWDYYTGSYCGKLPKSEYSNICK